MKRALTPLLLLLLILPGCSHLALKSAYETRLLVLEMKGCKPMSTLELFEKSLFYTGFTREPVREDNPIALELREAHVSESPKFITYVKTDLDLAAGEIENSYHVASCEQGGGGLYLVVTRLVDDRDPEGQGRFLGARFTDALNTATRISKCTWAGLGSPKKIQFYDDATEAAVLEKAKKGLCQEIVSQK